MWCPGYLQLTPGQKGTAVGMPSLWFTLLCQVDKAVGSSVSLIFMILVTTTSWCVQSAKDEWDLLYALCSWGEGFSNQPDGWKSTLFGWLSFRHELCLNIGIQRSWGDWNCYPANVVKISFFSLFVFFFRLFASTILLNNRVGALVLAICTGKEFVLCLLYHP